MTSKLRRPDAVMSADLIAQADQWATADNLPISDSGPWTLALLKSAARVATSRCRMPATSCLDDPYELAVLGVGYAIAVNPEIGWHDAVFAGQDEIFDANRRLRHSLGISRTGNHQPAPNYWCYWLDTPTAPPGTSAVDSRLTLAAVLTALPDQHLDTLMLLAWTDNTQAAADAAGITYQAMAIRARKARRAALALWFDGEQPPNLRRLLPYRANTRTCRQGHEITGDNIRWDRSASGRRFARCKTCRTAADRKRSTHA